jgi:hypothetical protein
MDRTALTTPTHTLVHTAPSAQALDVAVEAWLDAKAHKSGSAKTKRAYGARWTRSAPHCVPLASIWTLIRA